MTVLLRTINIRFVSSLRNLAMFGQGILERIGLLKTGTGVLG